MSERPLLIDEITLICKGCQGERVFPLPERIRSGEGLIAWMQSKATPCSCGATHCDVKARLVNPS